MASYNPRLYPRTITVLRRVSQLAGGGGTGPLSSQFDTDGQYFGLSAAPSNGTAPGEQTILTGVPCSIQGLGGRAQGLGEVPSDAPGPPRWRILIPASAVPKGAIQYRDVVVDDSGRRMLVSVDYWNILGWRLETVSLEN